MRQLSRVGLVATAALLLTAATADRAAAQAKCQAAKAKAAGKKAGSKAKCQSKAVSKGEAVDPECLTKAETKFSSSFAKAEAKPPCATTGDAAAIEGKVDAFIADLGTTLGGPGPNACSSAKYKASGKYTSSILNCIRKAVLKNTTVDPACTMKAFTKLQSSFTSADGKGACITAAGVPDVQAIVDALVNDVGAELGVPCAPAVGPFSSAKVVSSTSELVKGPMARGQIGDVLLENDQIRVVIQQPGRVMFGIGTYGGNIIDADLRRTCGNERDSFEEITPLINLENTANYTNVTVLNDGTNSMPAVVRATGPDDLLDFINASSTVASFGFPFPAAQDDTDLPIDVQTDYILEAGKPYVKVETTLINQTATPISTFFGDIMNGSGQIELFTPGLGFGEPLITDACPSSTFQPCTAGMCDLCDFVGYSGEDFATGVSYGYIHAVNGSSNFNYSGATVALLGRRLAFVLIGASGPNFTVPGNGTLTITRYFAVADGTIGAIEDIRNNIRGVSNTGTLAGVVTENGAPLANADVVVLGTPYTGGGEKNVFDHFHTDAAGAYGGTLPAGNYTVRANKDGHLFGTPDPANVTVTAGGTTTQNFDLPVPGQLVVSVKDEANNPVPAKVQLVGFDPSADPLNKVNVLVINSTTGVFGAEVPEVDGLVYGIAWVDFADKNGNIVSTPIEPGTYQVVVSHGPRYSSFIQNVTITSAATTTVNAQIARVINTPGFISADFHVHAINSPDCEVTDEERVATQLAEGMDFFTPSDHDYRSDFTPTITAMGVGNLISTATSAEITTFDYGHFNSWPVTRDPLQLNGGGVDWGRAGIAPGMDFPAYGSYNLTPQEIWAAANADPRPNLTQVNHMRSHFGRDGLSIDTAEGMTGPPQSHTPGSARRLDPMVSNYYSSSFEALEVWIGTDGRSGAQSAFIGENLGDWFNLLNQGILPTGVADSDTHQKRTTQINARNYVASAVTDPGMLSGEADNLAANIVAGKATGTNGPFVVITATTTQGSAGLGVSDSTIVETIDGNATVHLEIDSPLWAQFDKVQLFVNAKTGAVDDDSNPLTPPRYHALPGDACTVGNGCLEQSVSPTLVDDFPSIPGAKHYHASVDYTLTGLTNDVWVVALVRGTDGVSRPLFPVEPSNMLAKACSNNPCKACTVDGDCSPGTCSVTNQTLAELTDGNLNQCGEPTLAFTNPLFIDADGVAGYQPPGVQLAP
jgi:carboxypeptidase family protein